MGYACPVCETPQADGEHLANHLAFTALIHGEDHEAWLDEHVPEWADRTPAALAPAVREHADEVALETAFDAEAGRARSDRGRRAGAVETGELGPEARRIVEDAIELTREKHAGGQDGDEDGDGDGDED